jgi:hypothetical protein
VYIILLGEGIIKLISRFCPHQTPMRCAHPSFSAHLHAKLGAACHFSPATVPRLQIVYIKEICRDKIRKNPSLRTNLQTNKAALDNDRVNKASLLLIIAQWSLLGLQYTEPIFFRPKGMCFGNQFQAHEKNQHAS